MDTNYFYDMTKEEAIKRTEVEIRLFLRSNINLLDRMGFRRRAALDDKISRLFLGNGDTMGEEAELDLIGYLILKRIARKRYAEEI